MPISGRRGGACANQSRRSSTSPNCSTWPSMRISRARTGGQRDLIAEANMPEVRDRVQSLWGPASVQFHRVRAIEGAPPVLEKHRRAPIKKPDAEQRRAIIRRDGYRCRFCGILVIRVEVRKAIHRHTGMLYPGVKQMPVSTPHSSASERIVFPEGAASQNCWPGQPNVAHQNGSGKGPSSCGLSGSGLPPAPVRLSTTSPVAWVCN